MLSLGYSLLSTRGTDDTTSRILSNALRTTVLSVCVGEGGREGGREGERGDRGGENERERGRG